jgi:hypothetical protein
MPGTGHSKPNHTRDSMACVSNSETHSHFAPTHGLDMSSPYDQQLSHSSNLKRAFCAASLHPVQRDSQIQ